MYIFIPLTFVFWVTICVHVFVAIHIHMCMWRRENNVRRSPVSLSIYSFEARSLPEPRGLQFSQLGCKLASPSHPSALVPQGIEITSVHKMF